MTARAYLTIELGLSSPQIASTVERTLSVEADGAPPKTRCRVRAEASTLVLELEAEDAGSLRAAVNSYLRWAETAVAVAELASDARGPGS